MLEACGHMVASRLGAVLPSPRRRRPLPYIKSHLPYSLLADPKMLLLAKAGATVFVPTGQRAVTGEDMATANLLLRNPFHGDGVVIHGLTLLSACRS